MSRKDSHLYIKELATKLRAKRIERGYTIADICKMIGVVKETLSKIEKGESKNIIHLLDYARAVGVEFSSLESMNLSFEPLVPLSEEELNETGLTAIIRKHIINTTFLDTGKVVAQIKDELVGKGLIDKGTKSNVISNVMSNLLKEKEVSNISKNPSTRVYIKFVKEDEDKK
ncbi:helix-turn-helix domain-containing protein [Myroides guanonis]|uniref:Helix-turn-helix domain-containing protein n=1 Tax=Myroides guanonis TaxID=1150112 RepID=A0A1I3V3V1_9FLAO|nr:helix-turn-helix transcriptional regulator [Myroides guanonis]SFJ89026.1 Helix-turn-helix domain-containing protein [Myroides guanonis]